MLGYLWHEAVNIWALRAPDCSKNKKGQNKENEREKQNKKGENQAGFMESEHFWWGSRVVVPWHVSFKCGQTRTNSRIRILVTELTRLVSPRFGLVVLRVAAQLPGYLVGQILSCRSWKVAFQDEKAFFQRLV